MEPFRICVLFCNHPAWYDVLTEDYKSYDLTLHSYKAYDQAPPPAQIFIFKNLGRWEHNAGRYYDKLVQELGNAIEGAAVLDAYDIVSLLIGVNNQYRGRSATEFKVEFEHLLQKAIQFAGNKPYRVFVLSIPDWGVTPFAEGRDRKQVAEEIDAYNYICETSAKEFQTHFIDITNSQRQDGTKTEFLAPDGLHPSGKEYRKWSAKLADAIIKELQ